MLLYSKRKSIQQIGTISIWILIKYDNNSSFTVFWVRRLNITFNNDDGSNSNDKGYHVPLNEDVNFLICGEFNCSLQNILEHMTLSVRKFSEACLDFRVPFSYHMKSNFIHIWWSRRVPSVFHFYQKWNLMMCLKLPRHHQ